MKMSILGNQKFEVGNIFIQRSGSRKCEKRKANDNCLSFVDSKPDWSEQSGAREAEPLQG